MAQERRSSKTPRRESKSTAHRKSSTQSQDTPKRRGSKRQRSPEDKPTPKKRKVETKDEAFLEKEKEYDAALKPEYRRFRPKGYPLNPPPEDRPIRIYADGVFDLFHLGHMRQLEQCKKSFENVCLIVGIPNDKETHSRKGLTVLTDKQRYETVRHCRWVDEVIEDAPWIITMDFMNKHHIDYCAHDDLPYVADGIDDIYKPMKEEGRFLTTQRTDGISTSDIITKIIRDYDKYLMRNFERGATRKELNVSWMKKNELEMKKQINEFRDSWKNSTDQFTNRSKDLYTLVRESMKRNTHRAAKGKTPVDRFADKYNANGLSKVSTNRSFVDSLKDWVGLDSGDSDMDDYDVFIDDSETTPDAESADEHIPTLTVRRKRRMSKSNSLKKAATK